MAEEQLLELVRNVGTRLTRVEQILPGLATREQLQAAIAPLATCGELQAAIAPLATGEELQASLQAVIDLLKAEIKEEGERSRRYTNVMIEDLRDDNRLILEHLIALSARVDALAQH